MAMWKHACIMCYRFYSAFTGRFLSFSSFLCSRSRAAKAEPTCSTQCEYSPGNHCSPPVYLGRWKTALRPGLRLETSDLTSTSCIFDSMHSHYRLIWVWRPISMCHMRGCKAVIHILHVTPTCEIQMFNFPPSVSARGLSLPQGERGLWPGRGESSADRLACGGRYLLWELQDDPGLEIRKCPWLIWGTAPLIASKVRRW